MQDFLIEGFRSNIYLENVYLNGTHTLIKFKIKNNSDFPIIVSLHSTLGTKLTFQLSNANIKNDQLGSIENSSYQNELFNNINLVKGILLDKNEESFLVLLFLPESHYNVEKIDSFDFFDITGLVIFNSTSFQNMDAALVAFKNYDDLSENSFFDRELLMKRKSSNNLENLSEENIMKHPNEIILPFRARVCKSFLSTDFSNQRLGKNQANILGFDDCIIDGTYFRDFTVWNKSEINLYWNICHSLDSSFKFTDYETGENIDFTKPILSYSHFRVRITFKPKTEGEFRYRMELENVNDSFNYETIILQGNVFPVEHQESLIVASGHLLDFKECYAGIVTRQNITLKNVSDVNLDITFLSPDFPLQFEMLIEDSFPPSNNESTIDSKKEFSAIQQLSNSTSMSSSRPESPNELSSPPNVRLSTDSLKPIKQYNQEYVKIDDFTIKAGESKSVTVVYVPPSDNSPIFTKHTFRFVVLYKVKEKKEKKIISCVARYCSSFIKVSPKSLNFGETDVGMIKSMPITIHNLSEIAASANIKIISKVLRCEKDIITIPPQGALDIMLEIHPRKVSPEYKKQVNILNNFNKSDEHVVDVFSTNIDKKRITFHSLFYNIITPNNTNFIDFGQVIINSTVARSLVIENTSKRKLILDISTSSNEIACYAINVSESSSVDIFSSKESIHEWYEHQISEIASPVSAGPHGRPNSARIRTNTLTSNKDRKEKLIESMEEKGMALKSRRQKKISESNPNSHNIYSSISLLQPEKKPDSHIFNVNNSSTIASLDLATSITINKDGTRSPFRKPFKKMHSNNSSQAAEIQIPNLEFKSKKYIQERLSIIINTEKTSSKNIMGTLIQSFNLKSEIDVNMLVGLLEALSSVQVLPKPLNEEKYVRIHIGLNRLLETFIQEGKFIPINQVVIPPQNSMKIVLLLSPSEKSRPSISIKPRKDDSKISFKLLDFDDTIIPPEFQSLLKIESDNIPRRDFPIRSTICRSLMELGQKNLNFGQIMKGERKAKSIFIRNTSEIPLLYCIQKSGSVASGDLHIVENRIGIIRSYSQKEVGFVFDPSLAGNYQESLLIENVQNRENNQNVIVKALILKPSNFVVKSSTIELDVMLANEGFVSSTVTVTNTDKTGRFFEINFDPKELIFKNCYVEISLDVIDTNDQSMTKETEELIEKLEQKLKIARRKGRLEKVNKIIEKIDQLKKGTDKEEANGEKGSTSTTRRSSIQDANAEVSEPSEIQTSPHQLSFLESNLSSNSESRTNHFVRKSQSSIVFYIESQRSKMVLVTLLGYSITENTTCELEEINGILNIHEYKNFDVIKNLEWKTTVYFQHETYINNVMRKSSDDVSSSFAISREFLLSKGPSSFKSIDTSTSVSGSEITEDIHVEARPIKIDEAFKGNFSVDPKKLDLGKIEIHQDSIFYVKIHNKTSSVLLIDVFSDSPSFSTGYSSEDVSRSGSPLISPKNNRNSRLISIPHQIALILKQSLPLVIKGEQILSVEMQLIPSQLGKQSYSLTFRSSFGTQTFTFDYTCVQPKYLRFPSFKDELDLGYCYVDPKRKYSKIVSFPIENVSVFPLYIDCECTLSSQVSIFTDKVNQTPVQKALLPPMSSSTFCIAIQPGMKGDPRELVGGIKFHLFWNSKSKHEEVADITHLELLQTQTVKFKVVIGQSWLSLSDSVLIIENNIHVNQLITRTVTLSNLSTKMPCSFYIQSSSFIVVEPSYGYLQSIDEDSEKSKCQLSISFTAPYFGFYEEDILIYNENNPSQMIKLTMVVFLDDHSLAYRILNKNNSMVFENIFVHEETFATLQDDHNNEAIVIELKLLKALQKKYGGLTVVAKSKSPAVKFKWIGNYSYPTVSQNVSNDYLAISDLYESLDKNVQLYMERPLAKFAILPCSKYLLTDEEKADLLKGLKITQYSYVLIENVRLNAAIKVFRICHQICISKGAISPKTIDLGKIGMYLRRPIHIIVHVKNLSACPLFIRPVLFDGLNICSIINASGVEQQQSSETIEIPQKDTYELKFEVFPSVLQKQNSNGEPLTIGFKNLFNPNNYMTSTLNFEYASLNLRYEGVDGQQLDISGLEYPFPGEQLQIERSFSIENVSDNQYQIRLIGSVFPSVAEFIKIELGSNCNVADVTLAPNMKVQMVLTLKMLRLVHKYPELFHNIPIEMGKLCVELMDESNSTDGENTIEEIKIVGSISAGKSFSVAPPKITFDYSTNHVMDGPIEIYNHFADRNIAISMTGANINPIMINLMPLEKQQIKRLAISDIDDKVQVSKITFCDMKTNQSEYVTVKILEHVRTPNYSESSRCLSLRGCKRLSEPKCTIERFEIDLGQQDETSDIVKKIFIEPLLSHQDIENEYNGTMKYRVKMLNSGDAEWIKISKSEGTLVGKESQTITLTFIPILRKQYSSYIMIENLINPFDLKLIRISMEVVSQLKPSVFQVCYGSVKSHRSFIIKNEDSVSMEFDFTVSTKDPSEIVFSLSQHVPKVVKNVTLEPNSVLRVFFWFVPWPTSPELDDIDEDKKIEIIIKCRLIKNYQHSIFLHANCSKPGLTVDPLKVVFHGTLDENKNLSILPRANAVQITSTDPINLYICNDTKYFDYDMINNNDYSKSLVVHPKIEELRSSYESRKFIVDHFLVYNKNSSHEYYMLTLRLYIGENDFWLKSGFTLAPFNKSSHAYLALEERITRFFYEIIRLNIFQDDLATKESEPEYQSIYFEYLVIVDQLLAYGNRLNSGETFFQLASLLFTALMEEITPSSPYFNNWAEPFVRFLSNFVYFRHPSLDQLRRIRAHSTSKNIPTNK